MLNVQRKTVATCDENLWQYRRKYISRPNLRRRCCMCDKNSWQIATNFHRYCDGCGKIQNLFPMNYRRYCDDDFKFKKKIT
jgi:hypothetical protein